MVSTVTPPRLDTSLSVYAYVYIWWMKPCLSLRPLCFRFFVALKLRCFECTSPCCAASLSFISNQRSQPGSSAQLTVVVSARIHMDKPCEPCLGLYSFTHARAWWIRRRSSRAMRSEQKLHNGSKKMPFPYKTIHQSVLHKCSNAQRYTLYTGHCGAPVDRCPTQYRPALLQYRAMHHVQTPILATSLPAARSSLCQPLSQLFLHVDGPAALRRRGFRRRLGR